MCPMGRYQLLSELGRGGMGVVYRALHEDLQREVAFKVLHPSGAADLDDLKRFRREVKLAGSLSHPGIVRVFDGGEIDGRCYYTMEIIEGETIAQILADRGALPLELVGRYVVQAADALDHVHSRGLCHRDIKPTNLMVDGSGHLTVMDFGLARGMSSTILTRDGEIPGTPRYVAPEAIRQEDVSGAQDVWALALCAHEMLTGKPWVTASTLAELYCRILTGPAPSLESSCLDAPPWLLSLQARALARIPGDRPTARSYGDAFRANLPQDVPAVPVEPAVPAPPAPVAVVPRSPAGRAGGREPRPRAFALSAGARPLPARLLAGACLGLALVALTLLTRPRPDPMTRRTAPPVSGRLIAPANETVPVASPRLPRSATPPSPPSAESSIRTFCSGLDRLALETDAMCKGFHQWATGNLARLGASPAGARFAGQWGAWGWAEKNREYLRQTRSRDPAYQALKRRAGAFLAERDAQVLLAAASPLPPVLEYKLGLAMSNLVECAVLLDVRTARQLRGESNGVTVRLAGTMVSYLLLAALAKVQNNPAARLDSAIKAVKAGHIRLNLADRSASNLEAYKALVELHYLMIRCYEDLGERGSEGLERYRTFLAGLPPEIRSHPSIAGRLQRIAQVAERLEPR